MLVVVLGVAALAPLLWMRCWMRAGTTRLVVTMRSSVGCEVEEVNV